MTTKKLYVWEQRPGTDASNPKVMRGLKAIATRKNNDVRRMIDRKLPLFREQVLAETPVETPETVLARRITCQENYRAWRRGFNELNMKHIREARAFVWRHVTREDFWRLLRKYVATHPRSRSVRWGQIKLKIERRVSPLSEHAELVLAWLEIWERQPPTHFELHRSCGDGQMGARDVLVALNELWARELVEMCPARPCKASGVPSCTTWRMIRVEGG